MIGLTRDAVHASHVCRDLQYTQVQLIPELPLPLGHISR